MGNLGLCLPDEYLMRGVELVGCPMAMQGLTEGIFSKKVGTRVYMSRDVRKLDFCICENKDADQLRSNRAADQRL